MADPKRPRKRLLAVAAITAGCVIGVTATIVTCLGGVTSLGAYMDLHGFTAAMRLAVVGAVAVVVIPLGAWVCAKQRDRAAERARRAQMRALSAETRALTPSSAPARHRKVA